MSDTQKQKPPPIERETVSTRSADPGWIFFHRNDGQLRGAVWFGSVTWYRSAPDEPYQTTLAISEHGGVEVIGCSAAEFADVYVIARREYNASSETGRKVRHLLAQHEAAQTKTRKSA